MPVTGGGSLQASEMLRISHCLDNRHTDGGEVVSLTHRPRSTPRKHIYFYLWQLLLYRAWTDEGLVYIVYITQVKHAGCYIYIYIYIYMYIVTKTLDCD
jgi:hypothetical protein